jgi:hypothetical protein
MSLLSVFFPENNKNPRPEKPGIYFADLLFYFVNADFLAICAHALKFYFAAYFCKQRIVRANAHILAGMNMCAALLDEDVASQTRY